MFILFIFICRRVEPDIAGAAGWRTSRDASQATPGRSNTATADAGLPLVHAVDHAPRMPAPAAPIRVSVRTSRARSVRLYVQLVRPGHYLPAVPDASGGSTSAQDWGEERRSWSEVEMSIAAVSFDGGVAVQQHTAVLADLSCARCLVRYRVVAFGIDGNTTVPYADDGSKNFAVFVYDLSAIPPYEASVRWLPSRFEFGQLRVRSGHLFVLPWAIFVFVKSAVDGVGVGSGGWDYRVSAAHFNRRPFSANRF